MHKSFKNGYISAMVDLKKLDFLLCIMLCTCILHVQRRYFNMG